VAVADHPSGPFIDLDQKPIFDPGYPVIDANVYFSKDGRVKTCGNKRVVFIDEMKIDRNGRLTVSGPTTD